MPKKKKILVQKKTRAASKAIKKGDNRSYVGDTKFKKVSEKRANRLEKKGYEKTKKNNFKFQPMSELVPQRATGSSASKKRNAAMISKMNKLHRGR